MPKNVAFHKQINEPVATSLGLFDSIILAVKQEQEKRQTKKIVYIFLGLFFISVFLMPFSLGVLLVQWRASGIFYFIYFAFENINAFLVIWQDFVWSIIEALPLLSLFLCMGNVALLLFSVRLFFYRKRLLLNYVINVIGVIKPAP
jgi:hypothetical protein